MLSTHRITFVLLLLLSNLQLFEGMQLLVFCLALFLLLYLNLWVKKMSVCQSPHSVIWYRNYYVGTAHQFVNRKLHAHNRKRHLVKDRMPIRNYFVTHGSPSRLPCPYLDTNVSKEPNVARKRCSITRKVQVTPQNLNPYSVVQDSQSSAQDTDFMSTVETSANGSNSGNCDHYSETKSNIREFTASKCHLSAHIFNSRDSDKQDEYTRPEHSEKRPHQNVVNDISFDSVIWTSSMLRYHPGFERMKKLLKNNFPPSVHSVPGMSQAMGDKIQAHKRVGQTETQSKFEACQAATHFKLDQGHNSSRAKCHFPMNEKSAAVMDSGRYTSPLRNDPPQTSAKFLLSPDGKMEFAFGIPCGHPEEEKSETTEKRRGNRDWGFEITCDLEAKE